MKPLNRIGQQFARELQRSFEAAKKRQEAERDVTKVHITGVGASITKGYESLRNAAELSDDSLLLQRAIRRYFKRAILTKDDFSNSGEELIGELTLADYIQNDTITRQTADEITKIVSEYLVARKALASSASGDKLNSWTVDVMAVQIESILHDHTPELALSNLAYNYFLATLDPKKLFGHKPTSYEAMLLASVQKTLLKYDDATARYNLLARYGIKPTEIEVYRNFNRQIDKLFSDKDDDKLMHFIDRHGAEFRVLSRLISEQNLPQILENSEIFHSNFSSAISRAYKSISGNINRGVWRSVLFLIITKFVIGVALEVPYDLWTIGSVVWLPLAVNLAFPPIYMIVLRLTLMMPSTVNSRELELQIDRVIYTDQLQTINLSGRKSAESYGLGYQIFYTIVMLAVAFGVGYYLWGIGFSWLHLVIFYAFISAASFLGFRLSRMIREIETIDAGQSFVTTLRDFLYMPFVAIGRWVNEKYAKVNIISRILDMAVELPLKAILKWVRQWNNFLGAKKDEL